MAWSASDPVWVELHDLATAYAAGTLDQAGEDRLFGHLATTVEIVLRKDYGTRVRPHVLDEVASEMWIAMIPPIQRFDPTRCHFATHFYNNFIFARGNAFRRVYRERRRADRCGVSVVSRDLCDELRAVIDGMHAAKHRTTAGELMEFDRLIAPLSDRHRSFVRRYFVDGLPFRTIAAEQGITKQRAQQIVSQACGLLAKHWKRPAAMVAA